ncbi:MAG: hypothetical protein ACI4R8_03470, partial [Candidatus Caccovivens sp.]
MKKFAFAILGVFMILGGVLLSACEKQVSLSVSTEEVVIYTNDEQQENYQKKTIDVHVENSNEGIEVEVLKGEACVDGNFNIKRKTNGDYSFTINATNSGSALLKVYSIEDNSKSKNISVEVKTVLKALEKATIDNKRDLFVVKDLEKELDASEYFEFDPITANVCDIEWQFEETRSQEFVVDDILCAKIENNKLHVLNTYSFDNIVLRAVFVKNTAVFNTVTFKVLNNSTINNFVIEEKNLYQNNVPATKFVEFDVKRNNSNLANLTGTLIVNTEYDVSMTPVIYTKDNNGNKVYLEKDEIDAYFGFNIVDKPEVSDNKTKIYNFTIDAYDYDGNKSFGEFYLYFKISYVDYNYSIATEDVEVKINTAFSATEVDIYDSEKNVLNNSSFDVFSSYTTGNGFKITPVVGPDDVALDNNLFFLSVDLNQTSLRGLRDADVSTFAKFYCRGEELAFAPSETGSSVYVSKNIQSGTDIYISSAQNYDLLENVDFRVTTLSNAAVYTDFVVNFYKISTNEKLTATCGEETEFYVSSAITSSRTIDFEFKIDSLSTISGLKIVSDANQHFDFPTEPVLKFNNEDLGDTESYVIVSFTVKLNGANFADGVSFWFEHITGKKSDKFTINAFVPMTTASISNADLSSADVFIERSNAQGFVLKDGFIEISGESSTSLSKLMLEAGSILPLSTNLANATLTDAGVRYLYLSFADLVSAVKIGEGLTEEDEAIEFANQLFSENDLEKISEYFRYFGDVNGDYFSISQDKLTLTDNEFKGVVCVVFNGYNSVHEAISLARIFTLESFYSVKYLSSNVQTKLLYTTQTLSVDDITRSRVDVTISVRPDTKVPTYFTVENFAFSSCIEELVQVGVDSYKNTFYEINNISIGSQGRKLQFRITANSTNLQTSVSDVLTINYFDGNGFSNKTEIQIEIKNMKRIESVEWLNRTVDNEIYLNLTSVVDNERSFTISTSVSPSDAYDKGLTYSYFAIEGSANDLSITTSSVGQTFNLNINTQRGGYGNLYLLPSDMVKIVNGVKKLLVYKYDENGIESFDYVELSNLNLRYDDIVNGTENISNYFLNNDGNKVYYKDIIIKIAITIADGSSEGTAIRVYNQSELENIDTAKYYRIMNDITLKGWSGYSSFSGMIFGKDKNITLHFEDNSTSFVKENKGVIKDLTFTGNVFVSGTETAGFVANNNSGTIENCIIDVYYDGKYYKPSTLNSDATNATGGLVGYNSGIVSNSFVYGANIISNNCSSTGGLVGNNQNLVEGCGIEFYNFVRAKTDNGNEEETYSNGINAGTNNAGGMIGWAGEKSVLKNSFAYAYNLENGGTVVTGNAVGAFFGGHSIGEHNEMAKVEESFAYLGSIYVPVISPTNSTYVNFVNSYITYYNESENKLHIRIFDNVSFAYYDGYWGGNVKESEHLTIEDIPTESAVNGSDKWQTLISGLDSSIWQVTDIDSTYNFGFMYLKNTRQSSAVEINDVQVCDVEGKSIKVGEDKGVLFVYKPTVNISNVVEQSILESYNKISIADLFGVSEQQSRSLLVTSLSTNIAISSNTIKMLSKNMTGFSLQVHSKMDFTNSKTFTFVVVNALPKLVTTVDTTVLENAQTILLQTGKSRSVLYNLSSSIYLNNTNEPYALERDDFALSYLLNDDDENVNVSKSNSSLVVKGMKGHENGSLSQIKSYLSVIGLADEYNEEIKNKMTREFNISVYNGATSFVIENANNLEVRPAQFASFNAVMVSDNTQDNLVFALKFGEVELPAEKLSENAVNFIVDSTLTLEVSWTKTKVDNSIFKFSVLVKIKDSQKHLIEKDYENLVLSISPLSQTNSSSYVRTLNLAVRTQQLEEFSIATYNISNRFIKNSVLYMTPSNNIVTTLAPSTDAILALSVNPAYAKMSYFTLTYTTTGASVGTVSLSRLAYNPLYGYYVNSNSTTLLDNGIRVNLTETDKTGDGMFYFRIYISSQFASDSGVTLTATFFDTREGTISGNKHIEVDYLQDAVVKVNNMSTVVLAKGDTASVTVKVDRDQTLYSLYLQNNGSNILLSNPTEQVFENYKLYTASLTAKVNATLDGGAKSGIFYVCASVERTINNVQEIKVSRATVCLVDFAVSGENISVKSSGGTRTYNGKNYDVVYSYINDKQILNFNYPITPSQYIYDKNNADEVNAVEEIMQKRNQFALSNNYADEDVGYYINYRLNENVGLYQPLSLKEQLWYASDENNATAIYNGSYDQIKQSDMFTLERETRDGQEMLCITGKRSGVQLMKLQTVVTYQGTEFVYDYYFLVVVEVYSDEEIPTQITTAEEFIKYTTQSDKTDDYILMNDIVLNDYTPVDTDLVSSLDGNGYTIHINSFAKPSGSSLKLALFNTVDASTTLKNVRVNIYGAGQISVNISQYNDINIAGFAITNNGVIYNCEVVSYFDNSYQTSTLSEENGIVVTYTRGQNTDPVLLTDAMISALNIESNIAGFVITNNASIVNSRVGGKDFKHIVEIAGTNYVEEQKLGTFTILGQGNVAGFVCENTNNISACFAKQMQIYNQTQSDISQTAGFALNNSSNIQNSYVEGVAEDVFDEENPQFYNNLTNINSIGIVAGFVYENAGLVKNCYANIAIENSKSKSSMVAGFVYKNNVGAEVTLCYAACEISKKDINQMQFSGISDFGDSLNLGKISFSYFYNENRIDETSQGKIETGALSVYDVLNEDTFYGFSFSSGEDDYNGIWKMTDRGIGLVSADMIAFSNRYPVTINSKTYIFYNKNIMQTGTMEYLDLSYGGKNNPIIIRNARDFALATGKQETVEISAYKEYYSDKAVFGNYRIVNNIDMSEIGQSVDSDNVIKLKTTNKAFVNGILDGNGFTISNISLGSVEVVENFGLFAKLENSVVMNLSLVVDSVHNSQANIVGTLAGTAINSRILAINLSPSISGDQASDTAVHGKNIVGGIVGMLFGQSKLSDISIKDIYIFSSYHLTGKNILSNEEYIGGNLREMAGNGISLKSKVQNISYAGAVAGYVDAYDNINEPHVSFTTSLEVSDYDIVTVHVFDSVNIYGEIAGGLFGYIGNSTLVYDATLELNADMNLTNPSYITAKNLYAGGIVGENHGGLFAVSAEYEESLQKRIEENENNYYSKGMTSVERGQQSIFSLTSLDEEYAKKTNDPLFVGGLVGYMGGGYIYIGYNKLNVISHSANTVAVGGVVGLAGYKDTQFDLPFVSKDAKANVLLHNVYASGDLYVDYVGDENYTASGKGVSGGIIGALEITSEGNTSVVALKDVLAVNYYSYNQNGLVGDNTKFTDNKATSDKHFMLIGKFYKGLDDETTYSIVDGTLNENLYILNSDDSYLNLKNGYISGSVGLDTVGGYNTVVCGNATVTLNQFGWDSAINTERILKTQAIGDASMSTMAAAYARNNTYFLERGWEDAFWQHTEEDLFPHIELLPKINVIFWDYYNTEEVLEDIEGNYGATVVVRGKVSSDINDSACRDIDLTDTSLNFESIKNFKGRLMSYYAFINSDNLGVVTEGYSDSRGRGGRVGDRVGIITSKPLFENLTSGAIVEGLNIYIVDAVQDFTLVEKSELAIYRNLNIVLNNDLTINSVKQEVGTQNEVYNAGLITPYADSCSFVNIKVTMRKTSDAEYAKLTFKHITNTATTQDDTNNLNNSVETDVFMGVLAGQIVQTQTYNRIAVQGIQIVNAYEGGGDVDVNFEANQCQNLYVGLYAGQIIKKEANYANTAVSLTKIDGVNLNISSSAPVVVYAGGYAGKIATV